MEYETNTFKQHNWLHSLYVILLVTATLSVLSSLLFSTVIASAQSNTIGVVKQVSTGPETACAVVSGAAKCWGSNEFGQIGNGTTTNSSSPQAVSVRATAIAEVKECAFGIFCTVKVPYQPASALAGKTVEKVSVGTTHACALADAQVFCWGDNSHGQLGNRSTSNSSLPVAVDVGDTNATPKSALTQKEIIDVSAGELFTCALASDGTVACWGEGDNGRLGTDSLTDSNYPQQIYNAAGSAFAGKKGVKLAKAAGATMCVIAGGENITSATGSAYCWGYGIDDGSAIPSDASATTACSKSSPASRPPTGSTTTTVIFQSKRPVSVPGATFSEIDGNDYVSGLATNGRAYYWGMYGFTETASYTNITTCVVNPCTATIGSKIILAATANQQRARAQSNAQSANKPGGNKAQNLNTNNAAQQAAQNAARGGVSTSIGYSNNTGSYSYQTNYSTSSYSNMTVQANDAGYTVNVNNWNGVARPGGVGLSGANVGNNKTTTGNTGNACGNQTRYGYTKNAVYAPTGQKVATVPPTWTTTQNGITTLSGNVYNGLLCATTATGTACDAKNTSMNEGQTGSNYSQQCTTSGFIFTTTTCSSAPSGPQQVVATGWLAGKSVRNLSTGTSGYTCALANGSLGCWGINTKGQLGNGTTANKNVPTGVNL